MILTQHMTMVVRAAHVGQRAVALLLAANDHRHLDLLAERLLERGLQLSALRAVGGVVEDGLVGRLGHLENTVEHRLLLWAK